MANIALVGCAHIHTPGFVKRLQARADVSTIAVWDRDPARARTWSAQLGAPALDNVDAIWNDGAIDGVIICSETDQHEPLVAAAAAAGKHIFVEKPLGIGAQDAIPHGCRHRTGRRSLSDRLLPARHAAFGHLRHRALKDPVAQGRLRGRSRAPASSTVAGGALRDLFTPDWLWMTDRQYRPASSVRRGLLPSATSARTRSRI